MGVKQKESAPSPLGFYLFIFVNKVSIKTHAVTMKIPPKRITKVNPMNPQNGDVTHHQDQLINPVSFSVTNTTPRAPMTPIPPREELELLDIKISYCKALSRFPALLDSRVGERG